MTESRSLHQGGRSFEFLRQINLEAFFEQGYIAQSEIDRVVILAHTHCLTSTYYLFRELINSIGIPADSIILLPKPYSTIQGTARRIESLGVRVLSPQLAIGPSYDEGMQPFVEKICSLGQAMAAKLLNSKSKPRIILVDDGGFLTRQWLSDPGRCKMFDVISIQQTRSGILVLGEKPLLPIINVAQSAAKRKLESHIIADAIIRKTARLRYMKQANSVGVFGFGMIGKAIAKNLLDRKVEIHVCDENALSPEDHIDYWKRLKETRSRKRFVDQCDLIFGTTSVDWLQGPLLNLDQMVREKVLVSCSSRDKEFHNILQQPDSILEDEDDRFSDVLWHPIKGEKPIRVLNGGFPVNFDRRDEWEPPEEIALTRALILAAVLQAICTDLTSVSAQYTQLDPHIQRDLAQLWMKLCKKEPEDFHLFGPGLDDVNWWIAESVGKLPFVSHRAEHASG